MWSGVFWEKMSNVNWISQYWCRLWAWIKVSLPSLVIRTSNKAFILARALLAGLLYTDTFHVVIGKEWSL